MTGADSHDTGRLIDTLVADLRPVTRAPSPLGALAFWLAASLPVLAFAVWLMGPRPGLAHLLATPRFVLVEALSVATALLSAHAAFCMTRPDRSARIALGPILALLLWLAELGRQCVILSIETRGAALVLHPDIACIPAIAISALIPALVMAWLLHRTAFLRTRRAVALGALAAASAAEAALRLYHGESTMIMVLVWQMGSVALATAAFGLAGSAFLIRPRRLRSVTEGVS